MENLATTRMSSKGQVVIPEQIRRRLGLVEGVQFVVIGEGDAIVLKTISAPAPGEYKELLAKARSTAKRAKLARADVRAAIKKVRSG